MSDSVTLEGLDALQPELTRRLARVQIASPKAMNDVVMDLLGKSVALAPVDTGDLRGSGSANVTTQGVQIVGEVLFSEPYAVVQHEELSYHHPKGGQAKYLEQPLNENMDKYINVLSGGFSDAVQGKS